MREYYCIVVNTLHAYTWYGAQYFMHQSFIIFTPSTSILFTPILSLLYNIFCALIDTLYPVCSFALVKINYLCGYHIDQSCLFLLLHDLPILLPHCLSIQHQLCTQNNVNQGVCEPSLSTYMLLSMQALA